jgi:hypothetical protein
MFNVRTEIDLSLVPGLYLSLGLRKIQSKIAVEFSLCHILPLCDCGNVSCYGGMRCSISFSSSLNVQQTRNATGHLSTDYLALVERAELHLLLQSFLVAKVRY